MLEIKKTVWNGILYGNAFVIAQEAKSSSEDLRRWISIYANHKRKFIVQPFWSKLTDVNKKYSIVDFEVETRIINNNDGVSDIKIINCCSVETELELYEVLEKNNYDPEKFVERWKCDYPL